MKLSYSIDGKGKEEYGKYNKFKITVVDTDTEEDDVVGFLFFDRMEGCCGAVNITSVGGGISLTDKGAIKVMKYMYKALKQGSERHFDRNIGLLMCVNPSREGNDMEKAYTNAMNKDRLKCINAYKFATTNGFTEGGEAQNSRNSNYVTPFIKKLW